MRKLTIWFLALAFSISASAASQKDKACLVENIYREAGGESYEGKLAVAQVTLQRLASKKFGNTICKVVYAQGQFSWTIPGRKPRINKSSKNWKDSVKAAESALTGKRIKKISGAYSFHPKGRKPKWARMKRRLGEIGRHVFYAA